MLNDLKNYTFLIYDSCKYKVNFIIIIIILVKAYFYSYLADLSKSYFDVRVGNKYVLFYSKSEMMIIKIMEMPLEVVLL
jgi:hypothetical protein